MHPFTREILKHTGFFGTQTRATSFEQKLRDDILHVVMTYNFATRIVQAKELLDIFPDLRSDDFEASYGTAVQLMRLLYALQEVIPFEYFDAARRGEEDTALYRLFFQVKPAPTSVVVNDWLCEVIWNKPSSLITYSEDEGRFHLIRPNSQGRLSIEGAFLGTSYTCKDIWSQFEAIRKAVGVAERLYREGKTPATVGARTEAFRDW